MTRTSKRFTTALLLVCLVSSLCNSFSSAAYIPPDKPSSSNYLSTYCVGAAAEKNGVVAIGVDVTAVVNATEIGAKDIYIYEASSPSGIFTCVAHYSATNNPNFLGSGYYYSRTALRYNGTPGKYYTASVHVYAGNSTGGDTRAVNTNTVAAHN